MEDPKPISALVLKEAENSLQLAAMSARHAIKAAERVTHVIEVTKLESSSSLRSSAMRLRIIASEFMEAASAISAEAGRIDLMATLQVALAEPKPRPPGSPAARRNLR